MTKQHDKTIDNKLFGVDRFNEDNEYEVELEKVHELSKEAKSLIFKRR